MISQYFVLFNFLFLRCERSFPNFLLFLWDIVVYLSKKEAPEKSIVKFFRSYFLFLYIIHLVLK